jgi:hypothetical protein
MLCRLRRLRLIIWSLWHPPVCTRMLRLCLWLHEMLFGAAKGRCPSIYTDLFVHMAVSVHTPVVLVVILDCGPPQFSAAAGWRQSIWDVPGDKLKQRYQALCTALGWLVPGQATATGSFESRAPKKTKANMAIMANNLQKYEKWKKMKFSRKIGLFPKNEPCCYREPWPYFLFMFNSSLWFPLRCMLDPVIPLVPKRFGPNGQNILAPREFQGSTRTARRLNSNVEGALFVGRPVAGLDYYRVANPWQQTH